MDEIHLKALATLKDRMLRIRVHLPADIEDALRAAVRELVERQQRITWETCKRLGFAYLGEDVCARDGITVSLRVSPPNVVLAGDVSMPGVTSAYQLRQLVELRAAPRRDTMRPAAVAIVS